MTPVDAPYLGVADAIEHRIRTGELGPGDLVPSARQITRDWHVAMATASKALGELRRRGLTRPVPGVGTQVAEVAPPERVEPESRRQAPPARTAPSRSDETAVTRDGILRAAMVIADAEGLGALSMRRIARDLGVATMSLYRHLPRKEDLVLAMVDLTFFERRPPARVGDWRVQLELSARQQWEHYRRHPWVAQVMSFTRPQALPHGMAHTEWALGAFDGLGLDAPVVLHATVTLFAYVRGMALNLEAQQRDEQDTGLSDDEWMQDQSPVLSAMMAGRFPRLTSIANRDLDLTLDSLFEFGLERLLDGYGALIADTAQPTA